MTENVRPFVCGGEDVNAQWLAYSNRMRNRWRKSPINIYSVDIVLFKGAYCAYTEALYSELATYVKQMGYTHIGVCVSQFLGDEGRARLCAFAEAMHGAGIGVIAEAIGVSREDELVLFLAELVEDGYIDGVRADSSVCEKIYEWQGVDSALLLLATDKPIKSAFATCILEDRELTRLMLECMVTEYRGRGDLRKWLERFIENDDTNRLIAFPREQLLQMPLAARSDVDPWQRAAQIRMILGFAACLTGKKMLYMGSEIGQKEMPDSDCGLSWHQLDNDLNARLQLFVSELNFLYISEPALYSDATVRCRSIPLENVLFFCRSSAEKKLYVLVNLDPRVHENYSLPVHDAGEYREILNSDELKYGGSGVINAAPMRAEAFSDGHSLCVRVPPLAVSVIEYKIKNT